MNIHTDGRFICDKCDCPFVQKSTYLSHLRRAHSNSTSLNIIKDLRVPSPCKIVEIDLPDPFIQTLRGRTRWAYIRQSKQEWHFLVCDKTAET
jgi:hypothetical protein